MKSETIGDARNRILDLILLHDDTILELFRVTRFRPTEDRLSQDIQDKQFQLFRDWKYHDIYDFSRIEEYDFDA